MVAYLDFWTSYVTENGLNMGRNSTKEVKNAVYYIGGLD